MLSHFTWSHLGWLAANDCFPAAFRVLQEGSYIPINQAVAVWVNAAAFIKRLDSGKPTTVHKVSAHSNVKETRQETLRRSVPTHMLQVIHHINYFVNYFFCQPTSCSCIQNTILVSWGPAILLLINSKINFTLYLRASYIMQSECSKTTLSL